MSEHVKQLKWAIWRPVIALVAFNVALFIAACVIYQTPWFVAVAGLVITVLVSAGATFCIARAIDFNRGDQEKALRMLHEQACYWRERMGSTQAGSTRKRRYATH